MEREFRDTLRSSSLLTKSTFSFQCACLLLPGCPKPSLVLPQNSIIWGRCFDFCFSRFKTHWDHFYLGSRLFLQSRLFLTCVLMVLLLYSSKKTLSFSFKVMIRLHILWIGPLNAITAIILLWMEIGISSLAGMALLIIFMLLQSFSGKLFSSLR